MPPLVNRVTTYYLGSLNTLRNIVLILAFFSLFFLFREFYLVNWTTSLLYIKGLAYNRSKGIIIGSNTILTSRTINPNITYFTYKKEGYYITTYPN
jgi:hypothetical protein